MKKVGVSIFVIVAAVAICATVIFSLTKKDVATKTTEAASAPTDVVVENVDPQAYREEVKTIVTNFQANPSPTSAEKAHAALLGLRVPGDLRSLHLSLVLYFNAQSKAPQIDLAPLQQLTQGVDWL